MRIVVVGAGKLGYSIAELLSKEQFDVIVVDQDENQLEAAKNTLDVLTIAANGASPITMDDPDVRDADILIAVTAIKISESRISGSFMVIGLAPLAAIVNTSSVFLAASS